VIAAKALGSFMVLYYSLVFHRGKLITIIFFYIFSSILTDVLQKYKKNINNAHFFPSVH